MVFHQYGWTPSAASCGSSLSLDQELLILDTSNHLLLRYSSWLVETVLNYMAGHRFYRDELWCCKLNDHSMHGMVTQWMLSRVEVRFQDPTTEIHSRVSSVLVLISTYLSFMCPLYFLVPFLGGFSSGLHWDCCRFLNFSLVRSSSSPYSQLFL